MLSKLYLFSTGALPMLRYPTAKGRVGLGSIWEQWGYLGGKSGVAWHVNQCCRRVVGRRRFAHELPMPYESRRRHHCQEPGLSCTVGPVRQDRQDRTGPSLSRLDSHPQDKTRQDKTGHDMTRQDKTGQERPRQDRTRQDKTGQEATRHDKT